MILVTGGLGYIGSHIVLELVKQYEGTIVIVDNLINSSLSTFETLLFLTQHDLRLETIDLQNASRVNELFERYPEIHTVIHCAALKSVPESIQRPQEYIQNNVMSTMNLVVAMLKHNVKNMIFSSSCAVYGETIVNPIVETTPFHHSASSPYALSKRMCEDLLRAYPMINSVILRYFNPVGCHSKLPMKVEGLVPIVVSSHEVRVFGTNYATPDGTAIRDYVHIEDIARAHVHAIQFLNVHKQSVTLNLGSGKPHSVREVIACVEEVSGEKRHVIDCAPRHGDISQIYANNNYARSLLKWTPVHDLKSMVQSCVEHKS